MSSPQYTQQPKLIATWDFSDFTTVNSTRWKTIWNVLKRNAKQRTFIVINKLDQPTSGGATIQMIDSTEPIGTVSPSVVLGGSLIVNSQLVDTSEYQYRLASHVDSITIGIPIGATLPLSGVVKVYIVEMF